MIRQTSIYSALEKPKREATSKFILGICLNCVLYLKFISANSINVWQNKISYILCLATLEFPAGHWSCCSLLGQSECSRRKERRNSAADGLWLLWEERVGYASDAAHNGPIMRQKIDLTCLSGILKECQDEKNHNTTLHTVALVSWFFESIYVSYYVLLCDVRGCPWFPLSHQLTFPRPQSERWNEWRRRGGS